MYNEWPWDKWAESEFDFLLMLRAPAHPYAAILLYIPVPGTWVVIFLDTISDKE